MAAAAILLACSGGGKTFGRGQGGDAGESSGGSSNRGGSTNAGTSGDLNAGGAADTVTDVACDKDGARQCSDRTPQRCSGGFWVSEPVCAELCRGDGRCVCDDGTARCQGNTPQTCESGAWVDGQACEGATPACTGAGVCAAFVFKHGGIEPFAVRSAEGPDFVLKEQSLSASPRVCGTEFCVTGAIQ